MIGHWTIFEGTPGGVKREQARVTLGMNKTISLNRVAFEELGKPIAIELRFDRNLDPHRTEGDEPGVQERIPDPAEKELALSMAGRRCLSHTLRHHDPVHGPVRRRDNRQRGRYGARHHKDHKRKPRVAIVLTKVPNRVLVAFPCGRGSQIKS